MKQYRCHKAVRAAKILDFELFPNGNIAWQLEGHESAYATGSEVIARGDPAPGDYLVEYNDGYVSWSPAAVFEAGYSEIMTSDAGKEFDTSA